MHWRICQMTYLHTLRKTEIRYEVTCVMRCNGTEYINIYHVGGNIYNF